MTGRNRHSASAFFHVDHFIGNYIKFSFGGIRIILKGSPFQLFSGKSLCNLKITLRFKVIGDDLKLFLLVKKIFKNNKMTLNPLESQSIFKVTETFPGKE